MILPMKKAVIALMKEDYKEVIKSLQKYGIIMIDSNSSTNKDISLELSAALMQRVQKAIDFTKKYEPKKRGLDSYQVVDEDEFKNVSSDTLLNLEKAENIISRLNELKEKIKHLEEDLQELSTWENLIDAPCELKHTKYTRIYAGYILKRDSLKFLEKMKDEGFECFLYGEFKNMQAVVCSSYFEDEENLLNILKNYEFSAAVFKTGSLTVKEKQEELKTLKQTYQEEIENCTNDLKMMAEKGEVDKFRVLNDQILSQEELDNVCFDTTIETKIIEGWITLESSQKLIDAIKEVTDVFEVELRDPLPFETVPTATKNNEFVSQFDSITDMFSKPSQKDLDPNPVMSIWYWLIFGMMMGDVGYGLVMILACFIFKKLKKPQGGFKKIINIIMYSGFATIFWGFIFGSYFGYNPANDFNMTWVWYWFSPMDDPIMLLVLSVALGALHLITGLIMKSVMCIKEKDYATLLSKNVSWTLILLGIGGFALGAIVLKNEILKYVGMALIALGVLLILLFAGASKKSIFGKAIFGLLGLYDVTSYLGDLLSYSRIMALTMSSAAIAMVMNTLVDMVGGSIVGAFFGAIIFIIGHIFNLALGLLSAYVHDGRLQYVEFFGKFYIGGGVDFKPLTRKTKYVKEIKEN